MVIEMKIAEIKKAIRIDKKMKKYLFKILQIIFDMSSFRIMERDCDYIKYFYYNGKGWITIYYVDTSSRDEYIKIPLRVLGNISALKKWVKRILKKQELENKRFFSKKAIMKRKIEYLKNMLEELKEENIKKGLIK